LFGWLGSDSVFPFVSMLENLKIYGEQ